MEKYLNSVLLFGALSAALVFFCGCHANVYYQAKAVERARTFLLKEAKELTLEEQNFVRYNSPILLHGDVLDRVNNSPGKMALRAEQRQICVTWCIPTREKLYLVFGVSRSRMDDWYPNRLIRRTYRTQNYVLQGLAAQARDYAQNNLFDRLDALEINEIRFVHPWLIETDFELNCDPEGTMTDEEREAARKELEGKSQYSLVWKFKDKAVVFCGLSTRSLGGWSINFAGIISLKELDEHTRHVWITPQQALEPLPEELRDPNAWNRTVKESQEETSPYASKLLPPPVKLKQLPAAPATDAPKEK